MAEETQSAVAVFQQKGRIAAVLRSTKNMHEEVWR